MDESKIWDVLPKLKKIREMKEAWKNRRREQRLADLFRKVHTYKDVTINIPNLFAVAEMEAQFGAMDEINLDDVNQLCTIVVLLDNQHDPDFARLSPDQREALVIKFKQTTPAGMLENYAVAVHEVFWALKKNSIWKQRQILEQTAAILAGAK